MGRLQGAALRAKKRGNAAAAELLDQSGLWAEQQLLARTANAELFVLDTTALPVPNYKPPPPPPPKKAGTNKEKKHSIPKLQQKKVQELLAKHDPKAILDMVKKDYHHAGGTKRRSKVQMDLWKDSEEETKDNLKQPYGGDKKHAIMTQCAGVATVHTSSLFHKGLFVRKPAPAAAFKKKTAAPKTVAVQPALAGQSYHPDPQHHQDVIGEALALELRRQQMETYVTTPISNGMKEETKALLVTDDRDESEDEEEVEAKEDATLPKLMRRTEKLTRAQRNKQKRVRAEQAELQQRKRAKTFLHQVAEVKKIKREIIQDERTKQQRREMMQEEKQQQKESATAARGSNLIQKQFEQNPLSAPSLPVALSSDYQPASSVTADASAGPSLRTIHPKGSLVTERLLSYRDRQLVVDSSGGKERKRIVQGKKRKLRVKGKGFNYAPADADFKLMG